jgi:hypothetical protein
MMGPIGPIIGPMVFNYLLDITLKMVFKFDYSWVYVSKTTLSFSSP